MYHITYHVAGVLDNVTVSGANKQECLGKIPEGAVILEEGTI